MSHPRTICLLTFAPWVQKFLQLLPRQGINIQLLNTTPPGREMEQSLSPRCLTGQDRGHPMDAHSGTLALCLGRGYAWECRDLSTDPPATTTWECFGKHAHTAQPSDLATCHPPHIDFQFFNIHGCSSPPKSHPVQAQLDACITPSVHHF